MTALRSETRKQRAKRTTLWRLTNHMRVPLNQRNEPGERGLLVLRVARDFRGIMSGYGDYGENSDAGGAYRFEWRNDDGGELAITGVHQEVSPPERLVATESWGPGWPEAVNTIVFTEEDGRTTISITVLYPSKEARDAAIATGMSDGMSVSFDRLDRVVADLS